MHSKQKEFSLGIEFGSTRIKAVLIDTDHVPVASGGHNWENRLENGIWTYSMEAVWSGLQNAYAELAEQFKQKYSVELTEVGSIGISGMMHGYLPFDEHGNQLAPFRTWRNTTTEQAAVCLTEAFGFNIPQRWSVAHLYQSMLNGEKHVNNIDYLTTLAGYVHWKLTGQRVIGTGEASGMFPLDHAGQYDSIMSDKFDAMSADKGYGLNIRSILPKVLEAGMDAGNLTAGGAKLLDPSGRIESGIPLCPPEGDAGTGMTATNSVTPKTGNVSAGTSIFAMVVLENGLSAVHPEIDIITTPVGKPVAMVHGNNCTSDLDAWVGLLGESIKSVGGEVSKPELYDALYAAAMNGDADCGGLVSYNYLSGEHLTGFEEGRPLFARMPDSKLSLGNFMRTLLYSTMATLKQGMDILTEREKVAITALTGHGGLFKTPLVGQTFMAGALNISVSVMESAGEGGAWGIALLAAYRLNRAGKTLEQYLAERVFGKSCGTCVQPDAAVNTGFAAYMNRYKSGLAIERAAVENLK